MKISILAEHLFHPVGQGLFASGHLTYRRWARIPAFNWVYDCGTKSTQTLIDKGLKALRNVVGPERSALDLVVISHFDVDHISGIVRLLSSYSVKTLVIPQTPLWQRLCVLFRSSRYVEKRLIQFYLDPISAIRGIQGVSIDKIVLVPPSSPDSPTPPAPEGENSPLDPGQNGEDQDEPPYIELKTPSGTIPLTHDPEFNSPYPRANIHQIPVGGSLTYNGLFEFIPYNDTSLMPPPVEAFERAVQKKASALLNAKDPISRKEALKALKREYHNAYSGPFERNAISLYLYAGPTTRIASSFLWHRGPMFPAFCYSRRTRIYWKDAFDFCYRPYGPIGHPNAPAGVLYTGDGYLNSDARWQGLLNYYGAHRVQKLYALQVMHHGSRNNWHNGIAGKIRARVAVFSSDPNHKTFRHPHCEVVKDFTAFSAIATVNKQNGCALVEAVA